MYLSLWCKRQTAEHTPKKLVSTFTERAVKNHLKRKGKSSHLFRNMPISTFLVAQVPVRSGPEQNVTLTPSDGDTKKNTPNRRATVTLWCDILK